LLQGFDARPCFDQIRPEKNMADDKSNSGGQDRRRINVNEDYELRDWAAKFGVTTEQLKQAVADAGDRAAKVEQHLKGKRG
jgi:hypothetical protein